MRPRRCPPVVPVGTLLGGLASIGRCQVSESFFYQTELDCRRPQAELPPADNADGALDHVHVAYASNAGFFVGLFSSMLSLTRHLAEPARCTIHLIVPVEDHGAAERMLTCWRAAAVAAGPPGRPLPAVMLHAVQPLRFNASDLFYVRARQRKRLLPSLDFVRFYVHEYLVDAPRVVWLEPDMIVLADVAAVYRMRMSRALAAVQTAMTFEYFFRFMNARFHRRLRRHVLDASWENFNAGMLVYDLGRWRSAAHARNLERWTRTFSAYELAQLALNLEFQQGIDSLPWGWNVVGAGNENKKLPRPCLDGARIVHYGGACKPFGRNVTVGPNGQLCRNRQIFRKYAPRTSAACLAMI